MSYPYENALWGNATYIENTLLPTNRARLNEWETAARAAGVYEGTIISAVLQPWNAWDQGMADLAAIAIPNELKRVQAGGADGNLADFRWTFPPALPDVQELLAKQGGALAGTTQYTAALSPQPAPAPVELPPAVLVDQSPALASVLNNMAPDVRPSATPGGAPLDPVPSSGVLGDAPQSGSLTAGNVGGAPLTAAMPNVDIAPPASRQAWLWALAALAAVAVLGGSKR